MEGGIRDESLLTIPELAKRKKTKPSYWYEKTRKDDVPGLRRIGKFVRVDWSEFHESTRVG